MEQRTVAIIGASADRAKFGNKCVRAHLACGWTVYAVNPRRGMIEGLTAYSTLDDAPRPIRRVSLYVPAEIGVRLLPQIAAARPDELYVNPGAGSPLLLAEARRLGLPVIEACNIVALGRSPAEFPD